MNVMPVDCPHMDLGHCRKHRVGCSREICDEPASGWDSDPHKRLIARHADRSIRMADVVRRKLLRLAKDPALADLFACDLNEVDKSLDYLDRRIKDLPIRPIDPPAPLPPSPWWKRLLRKIDTRETDPDLRWADRWFWGLWATALACGACGLTIPGVLALIGASWCTGWRSGVKQGLWRGRQ